MLGEANAASFACEQLKSLNGQPTSFSPASSLKRAHLDDDADGKDNAVSALQELIQSSASVSPNTRVLTWDFEQQFGKGNSLEFRATVSFVLGDVPHHFSGFWQTSKKKAQRDAAERVTHYLQQSGTRSSSRSRTLPSHAALGGASLPAEVLRRLHAARNGIFREGEPILDWKLEEREVPDSSSDRREFRATLTFSIYDVPHHFSGDWCSGSNAALGTAAARRDTVERVLWYFGHSAEGADIMERSSSSSLTLPWQLGGLSDTAALFDKQPLQDKTVLMEVQNTLQKAFSRDTTPGQRVWVWSYEDDENDPQLFRARVEIPSWGRSFHGGWCRGKKLAQRDACHVVKDHLAAMVF